MLDARIASVLNKIIQNSYFKKKVRSGGTESSERRSSFAEDRSRTWSTTTSGSLALMMSFLITLICSHLLFAMMMRWDEVLLSLSRIPSDDILDSLYKLRIPESDQLKSVLELYDMEIHQKISMPDYQKLKLTVKKVQIRNPDCETLTPDLTGRIAGEQVVLKEDKENAVNWKQKDSVREETGVVSNTMKISAQNRHQKPLNPLSHQNQEVEVHRGKRTSEAGVHLRSSLDSRAEITWKVFEPNHLVTIGMLPMSIL